MDSALSLTHVSQGILALEMHLLLVLKSLHWNSKEHNIGYSYLCLRRQALEALMWYSDLLHQCHIKGQRSK